MENNTCSFCGQVRNENEYTVLMSNHEKTVCQHMKGENAKFIYKFNAVPAPVIQTDQWVITREELENLPAVDDFECCQECGDDRGEE
jgi:hypothetical protein